MATESNPYVAPRAPLGPESAPDTLTAYDRYVVFMLGRQSRSDFVVPNLRVMPIMLVACIVLGFADRYFFYIGLIVALCGLLNLLLIIRADHHDL